MLLRELIFFRGERPEVRLKDDECDNLSGLQTRTELPLLKSPGDESSTLSAAAALATRAGNAVLSIPRPSGRHGDNKRNRDGSDRARGHGRTRFKVALGEKVDRGEAVGACGHRVCTQSTLYQSCLHWLTLYFVVRST